MKKLMMALAAALMLAACEKNEEYEVSPNLDITIPSDSIETHATITFCFGGDADIQPMTRATLAEMNLTDVWVFDYIGDALQTTVHQTSTDTDFGQPSLSMEYGTHTLYFVASRGSDPTVDTDAKTIIWGTVRDTFWSTLSMTVSPSTATSQSVILSRIVGRLKISATDVVPATAAKFTITPSTWYYGLNYQSSEALSSQSTPISVNIPSSYIGTTNLNVSVYTISGATQWTTAVTAALKTSDDTTLGSVTITDIPIQRNHITSYGGGIINTGRAMTITIDDDEWIEDTPVTW
jgi:hypothetical protein